MPYKSENAQNMVEGDEGKDKNKKVSADETQFRIPGMDGQTGSITVRRMEEFDLETPVPGREPYRSRLRLLRGRIVDKPYWREVWKPIPLIAYPAILFSTVVHG